MLIQEIKNRASSIKSIRKITHAMELVATSKLQKVKKHFECSQDYFNLVTTTFKTIFQLIPNLKNVLKLNLQKPILYIVITGDYGLCGVYNNNVLKLAIKNIKVNDQIVVFGTKGENYFKAIKREVIYSLTDLEETFNYHSIHHLINLISNKLLSREIQNIAIVSTSYINSMTFNTKIEKIIDLNPIKLNPSTNIFAFEPNPEIVLIKTLPLYIGAIIYGKIIESKVAETAMRRIAMESATDNADDLISNLSVKYNQARQTAITQEIAEIVSGSENY